MNYILDYATKNNQQIDDANLISDFMINVIGAFEEEILNLKKDEYNLNITNQYLDKLVNTMDLDDNTYENSLRCKTNSLFKYIFSYKMYENIYKICIFCTKSAKMYIEVNAYV